MAASSCSVHCTESARSSSIQLNAESVTYNHNPLIEPNNTKTIKQRRQ